MPNRIIKESIRTSRAVNAMTDFQFRLWVYLITYVDDYGRGSADPELIRAFVFPRRKRVSESDLERTLAELAGMGCIHLYQIDGESYFCFPNWGNHQRIQTKKSKFPAPEPFELSQKATVDHGEARPESEPNPKTESESVVLRDDEPPRRIVIELPLNSGAMYPVYEDQAEEWALLYQAVEVGQELRRMRGWLDSNPRNRKTQGGVARFITGWLSRAQDKAPNYAMRLEASNPFKAMLEEGILDE